MSANPWLSGIGFLFGGKIVGAGLKVLGSVFAEISKSLVKKGAEALGITEKAATGTPKNPYSVILQEDLTKEILKSSGGNEKQEDPVAQAMDAIIQTSATQVDEAKNVADDAKKNNKKNSKEQSNAIKKSSKETKDMTKKAAGDISKSTQKASKQQTQAIKKASTQQSRAIKKGSDNMKKATDKLNKNVKGFGTQTKKLFNKLGSQMKGLFRDLKSAVSRIGKGAGGMLSMLGPIGMVASLALPAINAIVSGEGLGGALEAIDPTGLVGSVRSREEEVPEMADGAIIKRRKKVYAGEAGPEAIIPLTDFNAKLERMITALEDLKKGGGVYMDTRLVGEALVVGGYKL